MKRALSDVAVGLVALAVGFYFGARYVGKPVRTIAPMLGSAWLGERAVLLFHEGNYDEAHAALMKYVQVQKELAARPDLDLVAVAQGDLALTYMRLAILEERRGNKQEAARLVAESVSYATKAGWKNRSAEGIRWLVEKIEQGWQWTPTPGPTPTATGKGGA
jgi:hypothetical protein